MLVWSNSIQRVATDSYAVFGEVSIAPTEDLKLTVGARETWERKGGNSSVAYSIVDPTHLFPAAASYAHSWSALTPKVNLSYQPIDGLMLYASVTKGFKSGGYDLSGTGASSITNVALAFATPFAPETEMSYDIGEKFIGFNDQLVVNGDVFLANYKNLQTSQLVLLPDNQLENITSNAPGITTVQGLELETTALPKPCGVLQSERLAFPREVLSRANLRHIANPRFLGHRFVPYELESAGPHGQLVTSTCKSPAVGFPRGG
jgi:iron complex outermembrane recepter protein